MRSVSTQLILLGSLYLIFGSTALAFASTATMAAVVVLGAVLFCLGISQIYFGIQGRKLGQLWPNLGLGCLALVCAVLIARNPVANTLGLTLAISFLLIAGGLTKFISAVVDRKVGWGWFAGSGLISLLLGGIILGMFPMSAIWTVGTLVGVDLIVAGISSIGLGVSIKEVSAEWRSSGFYEERRSGYERNRYEKERDEESRTPPLH